MTIVKSEYYLDPVTGQRYVMSKPGGTMDSNGDEVGSIVVAPYIAPLETRTFIIDSVSIAAQTDAGVPTAGVYTPVLADLIKMGGFPAASKRLRIDLHFPALAVPHADAFLCTINAGTGTGDDTVALARLPLAYFTSGDVDAGDTSQRGASASVPTIQWDMNIQDSADIVENLYILPLFLGGGTGAGTVLGTVSVW